MGFMPLDEKHGRYVLSLLSEDTVRGRLSASHESPGELFPEPSRAAALPLDFSAF